MPPNRVSISTSSYIFFIKLYQEGYRVNSIGQLEINGTLANSNILCNEDLNRQGIRDVMSMSERS